MPSSPAKHHASTVPNLDRVSPGGPGAGRPGLTSLGSSPGKPKKKNDRPDLEDRDTYFTDKEKEVEDVADALSEDELLIS